MTKKNKIFSILAVLAVMISVAAFADNTAKVIGMKGQCQYQLSEGEWLDIQRGDEFPMGATVSTKFNSELTLKIGASTVKVGPLSRMRIGDIDIDDSKVTGSEKVLLYVDTGTVYNDVKRKNNKALMEYRVKTPALTASVRGTKFTVSYDKVSVTEGCVGVIDMQTGDEVLVYAGGSYDAAAPVAEKKLKDVIVNAGGQASSGQISNGDFATEQSGAASGTNYTGITIQATREAD